MKALSRVRFVDERPAYRGLVYLERNQPDLWIAANLDLIRAWWRAGHEGHPHIQYDENDFHPFCRVQFDIERMRYDESKS